MKKLYVAEVMWQGRNVAHQNTLMPRRTPTFIVDT